eukprot:10752796-Heterocapsa_arctica.AAC.1
MERQLTPSLLHKSTRSEANAHKLYGRQHMLHILVNWIRQIEGGIHPDTAGYWEDFNVRTGNVRGPVNYFRRTVQKLGRKDNTPTNFTDHMDKPENWMSGTILFMMV